MAYVYCFQIGEAECYKVGRTKNAATNRLKSVSVGSPERLTLYRTVETEFAPRLERYIHETLAPHRAPNGEFFFVARAHLDRVLDSAAAFISENQPVIDEAEQLKSQRPKPEVLEPTDDISSMYRELKAKKRELFFLESQIEVLQSKLQVELGNSEGFRGLLSWKWQERTALNRQLLKRDHPDLYQQYCERSGSRVFRLE